MWTPLRLITLSTFIWLLIIGQGSKPLLPIGWEKLQIDQSYAACKTPAASQSTFVIG